MPRTKGSKNKPKTVTADFATQIAEKQSEKGALTAEIASITANIDTLKADLKEKKSTLKKAEKEVATLEAKKAKADARAAEEAKKAEAESVLKKLLAEGMSADEILVGILHRAAVAVGERVQARAGVIVQAIDVVRRESDGQVHAAAVGRVHRRALAKLEKRRVIAVQRNTVAGQAAVDELGGGVPAVFLGVAGVLAVLVKGEGRLADVVAVQVLVGQGVEQVAGVDVFIDVHRHGVEGQGHLQQQVAGRADGACTIPALRA